MRAVFIHDHNFIYNQETELYYDGSGGAFDINLWNRYLALFENLVVVGRQIEVLPNKLVVSSAENVDFRLIKNADSLRGVFLNRKKIKRALESIIKDADFVIIRLPSTLGRWSFDICQKLRKKCVLEIVGDPFEAYWYHGNWLGKIIAPIQRFSLRRITQQGKYIIYVTERKLQQTYPSPNITCNISNVRLEEVVEKEEIRKFYCSDEGSFRIGLIGSFHVKYKGHIEALKAIKQLKDKGFTNFELYLVGSGGSNWVRELAERYGLTDHVKIVGALSSGKNGIFPFLDKMHLYIHPSKTEGLPRVIIEAMSRGKICLGSDVGGTDELLEKRFIHSPGDWRTLANQIEEIHNSPKESRIALATNSLRVARQYLEEALQKRRADFITKIIEDGDS